MKALLVIAHGSRRAESNDEVRRLTDTLARRAQAEFPIVCCGFLELAEPSIPNGIEQCVQAGATEVVVLPYFLSAGRHVVTDIPNDVRGKQEQYPQVNIRIAAYLGAHDRVTDLLLESALIPA
ncbi:MAG: CbiX/SirB N-terminal domain-containing protein [Gammaproteobacteria bacterium]|nr:CbiX/SirB N-terminal domain-containing protein [Gammaproteobacteria bacterium]